jgi:hypothetical protein
LLKIFWPFSILSISFSLSLLVSFARDLFGHAKGYPQHSLAATNELVHSSPITLIVRVFIKASVHIETHQLIPAKTDIALVPLLISTRPSPLYY